MYDALESDVHSNGKNQSRLAENDYLMLYVLILRMVQAQLMGEQLKNIDFLGYVISSPSCRSDKLQILLLEVMTL